LFVDDEPSLAMMARTILSHDYDLHLVGSAEEAQLALARHPIDIVISDEQLPGLQGIPFLEWCREHSHRTVRILMTGVYSMEAAVEAINSGLAQRFLFKPWRPEQLVNLVRNAARASLLERSHENLLDELRKLNLELEERVADRTRELEHSNRQLEQRNTMLQKMALTDALTGLPNRRAMDRLAKTEVLRRARTPSPLAVAVVDADFFKDINTRFLLPGGDHVLGWLADNLVNSVRTIDTVGRVGGEEFMVVAPDTGFEGASILAERMRRTVELSSTEFNGEKIRLTVSVGMAVAEADTLVGFDSIRHAAAAALSEAKETGRNRCVIKRISSLAGPSSF
jgi:diguanylate cyclase (GGDEF)-like protein